MSKFTDAKRERLTRRINEMRLEDIPDQTIFKTLNISQSSAIRLCGPRRKAKKLVRTKKPEILLHSPVEIHQRQGMMIIAIGPEDIVARSLERIAQITGGQ